MIYRHNRKVPCICNCKTSVQKKTYYLMSCLNMILHVVDDMKSNKGLKLCNNIPPFLFVLVVKLNSGFLPLLLPSKYKLCFNSDFQSPQIFL